MLTLVCCVRSPYRLFLHSIVSNGKIEYMMKVNDGILLSFGNKIREIRKQQQLSQEDLADKAGLHRTYIGMIERAEKNITLININKIAKALNVEIKILFE